MKNVRRKVAKKLGPSTGGRPGWMPAAFVRLVRRVTGGDDWTSKFTRGLVWRYRRPILMVVLLNVLVAVTDSLSMGSVPLAYETLTKQPGSIPIDELGPIGLWVDSMRVELGRARYFVAIVVVGVVLQVMRAVFEYASRCVTVHISTAIEAELRSRMFQQFMDVRYASVSRYRVGDLVAYMQQVSPTSGIVIALNEVMFQSFTVVTYTIAIIWLAPHMSAVGLVGLVLFFFFGRRVLQRIRNLARSLVLAATTLLEDVVELLGGIRHIHTYGREEYATNRVETQVGKAMRSRRAGLWWSSSIQPAMQVLTFVAAGLFLIGGMYMVEVKGIGTAAAIVGFVAFLYRLMPRITSVNTRIATIVQRWPNVERVAGMLRRDDKQYVTSGSTAFPSLQDRIAFEEVGLQYDGTDDAAVDGLSFEIRRGEMTAFVGPSGAGKSTVVNLLLRLYDPTSGRIVVDGTPLPEVQVSDWRGAIGLVDQEPFVLHSSIRENIRFGNLDATDAEIEAAARTASAHDFIEEQPQGYDTVVGERGSRLSGGQRQRIVIARALVRKPSILVLDEATSALDSESERAIQGAIERIRSEFTVVAIAHRLSTIAMADQIIVLDGGSVAERGTHAELLEANGLYARLWRVQAGE